MNWGFKNLPVQCQSIDGLNFDLLRPLVYQARDGTVYRVARTGQTDGGSTPALLWGMGLPPFGQAWPAFILHDGGYRDKLETLTGGDWLNGDYKPVTLTKDQCDALLAEAMAWLTVDPVKIREIYDGVHLGGQAAFDKDRA